MSQQYVYISEEAAQEYKMILVPSTVFRVPTLHKQFICRMRNAKTVFNPDEPHSSINHLLWEATHFGVTHIKSQVLVSPAIDPTNLSTRYHMMFSGVRILVPLEDVETENILEKISS